MRYCVTESFAKKKRRKKFLVNFSVCLFIFIAFIFCFNRYAKDIIGNYPLTIATSIIQNFMEKAMGEVLSDEDIPDMSKISEVVYDESLAVSSIEVDTNALNLVKTSFIKQMEENLSKQGEFFTVKVPLGSLIGNEYTLGRGPKIPFKLQASANYRSSFESKFEAAGVNNTLHTIYLNVETEVYLLIPWDKVSKTVKTNYILSQTVISGKVPDAYTNVLNSNEELTNDLFDYRAELN